MILNKYPPKTIQVIVAVGFFTSFGAGPCSGQFRININNGYHPYSSGANVHVNLQELFKSSKLKFQEGVLKGDTDRAARYVKPEYVDDPIRDAPPICYAAARGNVRMVNLLVNNGAAVRRKYHGKSLVYIAAFYGQTRTAETLLDVGGGTRDDLQEGHAVYAKHAQRQREYAAAATVGALALVAAMMASQSGSSETDEEARDREIRMRQGSLLAIVPGW